MANFKSETEYVISQCVTKGQLPQNWEIDELLIYTGGCDTLYYKQTGGKIDWDAMAEALCIHGENPHGEDPWDYDDGYGIETFCGWITFKDASVWIKREVYDGSEWWDTISKPRLSDWKQTIARWEEEREEDD